MLEDLPCCCVYFFVFIVSLSYVDMYQQTAQLKFFVVHVLQLHGAESSLDAGQWVRCLTNEIRIAKNILVLNSKPHQGKVRVHNVKFASLIPYWIKSILLWNGNGNKSKKIIRSSRPELEYDVALALGMGMWNDLLCVDVLNFAQSASTPQISTSTSGEHMPRPCLTRCRPPMI